MSDDLLTLDADTIGIDFRANTLTVSAPVSVGPILSPGSWLSDATTATIDIGTRGRLLGIELDGAGGDPMLAVVVADPTPQDAAVMRTTRVPVTISVQPPPHAGAPATVAVVFSRHGDDYDISWPSGNQCWRRAASGPDGEPGVTCAVVSTGD